MSVEVTFQHLECVNPKNTDVIAIIGRQADGKSVCVKIGNVMPHLCIRNVSLTMAWWYTTNHQEKVACIVYSASDTWHHRSYTKRVQPFVLLYVIPCITNYTPSTRNHRCLAHFTLQIIILNTCKIKYRHALHYKILYQIY